MNKRQKRQQHSALQRRTRVRAKISGTAERPRLNVFKSNRGLYVQLIDDERGVTLASVSTKEVRGKGAKLAMSEAAGTLIAEKAKTLNINRVIFDRGAGRYQGRVKAIGESARAAGLTI